MRSSTNSMNSTAPADLSCDGGGVGWSGVRCSGSGSAGDLGGVSPPYHTYISYSSRKHIGETEIEPLYI